MTATVTSSQIQSIDALLPQTQCGQCGYPGCYPYAQALAAGQAEINRCPPGGDEGVAKLAQRLQRPIIPLDPSCGDSHPRQLARIIEADCIGCTKCIQACPVDAIIGSSKRMHTVISDLCTGCELCIPACPVDCIALEPMPAQQLDLAHADQARELYQRRQQRLAAEAEQRAQELSSRKAALSALSPIEAALARRRAREQDAS